MAEQILAEGSGLKFEDLQPHLYAKSGACAAHHLFGVASGLDSAVLGETEILAQIKSAVSAAREVNLVGRHLDFLVRSSQVASRRVRTETELCRNVTSIGSLAVRDAAHSTGGFDGKTVVVVGAGKIAERIAKDLVNSGAHILLFVNRTFANAESLATRYGGDAYPYGEMESCLAQADVVFTAASCDKPIIDRDTVQRVSEARDGRRLTLVDLGVPRNTHPSAADHPDWHVLDMDAILGRCGENSAKRSASVPRALEIMDEELDEYLTECTRRSAAPTIEALVKFGDQVKDENLQWAQGRLSHLSEKDLKVVSDLATRMAKGFLQTPIRELKEELTTEQYRDMVLKLFQLEAGGR
jgi:glutamyl-tRNA reductase